MINTELQDNTLRYLKQTATLCVAISDRAPAILRTHVYENIILGIASIFLHVCLKRMTHDSNADEMFKTTNTNG